MHDTADNCVVCIVYTVYRLLLQLDKLLISSDSLYTGTPLKQIRSNSLKFETNSRGTVSMLEYNSNNKLVLVFNVIAMTICC